MTQTLTRVYNDYPSAEAVVRDLKNAGLGDSHIGIVASNAEGWHKPGSKCPSGEFASRENRLAGAAA